LQEDWINVTDSGSIFAKQLAPMKTGSKYKTYRVANMTTNNRLRFLIPHSDADTEATAWSFTDEACVTIQLEREIYGITSNEQMWFRKKFTICLIEFEAWWESISIQTLWKTIQQGVIHFEYPKRYLVSHRSESIR
jgi:hypothetical protein